MNESPPYTIERIASSAASYLRRLPRPQRAAVMRAFEHLRTSPTSHPNPTTIKPLKGEYKGLWRYRVGDIRIIYAVHEARQAIEIVAIDNRGNVY